MPVSISNNGATLTALRSPNMDSGICQNDMDFDLILISEGVGAELAITPRMTEALLHGLQACFILHPTVILANAGIHLKQRHYSYHMDSGIRQNDMDSDLLLNPCRPSGVAFFSLLPHIKGHEQPSHTTVTRPDPGPAG
jgi:hypothetical protein